MFIIYDLVFLLLTLVTLPVYLFKRKLHRGLLARLGFMSAVKLDRPIWIHAVSVGEAIAIRGLLKELRQIFPGKKFVISTVTSTGNKIARSMAREGDLVTYLPADFSFIVRRVIRKISPELFIIAETEIWPNLIRRLFKQKIPVAVINGRISDNSFKGYSAVRFFMKPILNKIDLFCVQTARDAERLFSLGLDRQKVKITGNLKFDAVSAASFPREKRKQLGLTDNERLLVCGSTHPGEEGILLNVYRGLLTEFPLLRLLIAPRHPERTSDIERLIIKSGFQPLRISSLDQQAELEKKYIFILDTIGQLTSYYWLADIVFVGGSLVKKGGHNIIEPASLAKPVIFGHYMFNFKDVARLFIEQRSAVEVHNGLELSSQIKRYLSQPQESATLGQRARQLVFQNQGATLETCRNLKKLLQKSS